MADHSVGWAIGLFGEVMGDRRIALEKLSMVALAASYGRLGKQPSSKLRMRILRIRIISVPELLRNVSFSLSPPARGGWSNEDGPGQF